MGTSCRGAAQARLQAKASLQIQWGAVGAVGSETAAPLSARIYRPYSSSSGPASEHERRPRLVADRLSTQQNRPNSVPVRNPARLSSPAARMHMDPHRKQRLEEIRIEEMRGHEMLSQRLRFDGEKLAAAVSLASRSRDQHHCHQQDGTRNCGDRDHNRTPPSVALAVSPPSSARQEAPAAAGSAAAGAALGYIRSRTPGREYTEQEARRRQQRQRRRRRAEQHRQQHQDQLCRRQDQDQQPQCQLQHYRQPHSQPQPQPRSLSEGSYQYSELYADESPQGIGFRAGIGERDADHHADLAAAGGSIFGCSGAGSGSDTEKCSGDAPGNYHTNADANPFGGFSRDRDRLVGGDGLAGGGIVPRNSERSSENRSSHVQRGSSRS